jgi:hypothetical protein
MRRDTAQPSSCALFWRYKSAKVTPWGDCYRRKTLGTVGAMPSIKCPSCSGDGRVAHAIANTFACDCCGSVWQNSRHVAPVEQLSGLACLDKSANDAIGEVLGACAVGATLTLRTILGERGALRLAASLESYSGARYTSVAHESLGPLMVELAKRWRVAHLPKSPTEAALTIEEQQRELRSLAKKRDAFLGPAAREALERVDAAAYTNPVKKTD